LRRGLPMSKVFCGFLLLLAASFFSRWPERQCCQGAGKVRGRILTDLSKKGRKGAKLFKGLAFHKIIYISCQKRYISTGLLNLALPFSIKSCWKIVKMT
jgi:hypothetical protein